MGDKLKEREPLSSAGLRSSGSVVRFVVVLDLFASAADLQTRFCLNERFLLVSRPAAPRVCRRDNFNKADSGFFN